jgi:predicted nuclease of predicted toxin-antitoxin system
LDENVPNASAAWLFAQGHQLIRANEPPLRSSDDESLWAIAQMEHALLISTDKGFTARWAEPHFGILIIRLRQPNWQKIQARIAQAMETVPNDDEWRGLLCVMRDQTMSIRRAPEQPSC